MYVIPKRLSVYQIFPGTVKKKILANVQFTGYERLLLVDLPVRTKRRIIGQQP